MRVEGLMNQIQSISSITVRRTFHVSVEGHKKPCLVVSIHLALVETPNTTYILIFYVWIFLFSQYLFPFLLSTLPFSIFPFSLSSCFLITLSLFLSILNLITFSSILNYLLPYCEHRLLWVLSWLAFALTIDRLASLVECHCMFGHPSPP